jgi:hypothetical protein
MGRPRILNQSLIDKISAKNKRPPLAVVKSVSALASRKNVSSEIALILYAKQLGIGFSSALRALDPHKQTQLNLILNSNGAPVSGRGVRSRSGKRMVKIVPNIKQDYSDPHLAESVYKNIPSEGYSIMYALENSMRQFISRILSGAYGNSWWDEMRKRRSLSDVVGKVASRKTNESENWHHAKRGVHEIYYTDFADLLQIMKVFNPDFLKYFRKGKEKNLLDKLTELVPSRNVIAHNNPISADDLDRVKIHAKDWFKYMQHIHQKGIS